MAYKGKIVICGYYGYANAGDEIILRQLVKGIKNKLPEMALSVLTRPGEKKKRGYRNVNRYNPLKIFLEIRSASALMMGGGSLFQDKSGVFSIYYYFLIIIFGWLLGKKVIIFNQGIGPIGNSFNRYISLFIFRLPDIIIVRDEHSFKYLQKFKYLREKIFLGADPVFSLKPVTARDYSGRNKVAVSLRRWKNFYLNKSAVEIKKELKKYGYETLFLNMHRSYDSPACGAGYNTACKNEKEVFSMLRESRALVGMRLHSLMLGALAGLPMVGVSYDPKVESFCRYMEIPYVDIKSFSPEKTIRLLVKEMGREKGYAKKINKLSRRLDKSWEILKNSFT